MVVALNGKGSVATGGASRTTISSVLPKLG